MNKFGTRLKMGSSPSYQKSINSEAQELASVPVDPSTLTPDEILRRQESFQESMHLSVKEHIDKLEVHCTPDNLGDAPHSQGRPQEVEARHGCTPG